MHNPLETDFHKTQDFLVGIDSDGCAFDSMEIKHKECFIPNFIKYFSLQAISRFAREACEFTNLYSKSRGANRFKSYLLALDLLEDWDEVQKRGVNIPKLQGLRDWVERETKLGNPALEAEVEKTANEDLAISLRWSQQVNEDVDDMVHGVPPFPNVKASLEKLSARADMIVCSATPNNALTKEWEEHGIRGFVQAICGQEAGSKKETLGQAKGFGYSDTETLMIGDAPGDMQAAQAVGALFYPINPGAEEASWQRFHDEAIDRFFAGEYAGEYETKVIAEFEAYLPETPPWK